DSRLRYGHGEYLVRRHAAVVRLEIEPPTRFEVVAHPAILGPRSHPERPAPAMAPKERSCPRGESGCALGAGRGHERTSATRAHTDRGIHTGGSCPGIRLAGSRVRVPTRADRVGHWFRGVPLAAPRHVRTANSRVRARRSIRRARFHVRPVYE